MPVLYPEHVAVHHLQDAARRGVAALIPGALEARPSGTGTAVEYRQAVNPAPVSQPESVVVYPDAGGVPASPVTVRDRVAHIGLRLTEVFIRLLATAPKAGSV